MRILLVRHSDAVSGGGELDDAARWLSLGGRQKARRVGEALADMGLSITTFVSSPRVRAVQTAEIIAEAMGFTGVVESLPSLSFSVPASRAAHDLAGLSGNVAAFGHMPTIAEIAGRLCRRGAPASFAPSEAILIEDQHALWALDPDTLTQRRL
jgi:phosphohistidine phosphatase